jgi:hypothetical protein
MNLSFLDDLFGGVGRGFADVDKFVDREMPFDSGWGFPAALTAAYFAPYLIPTFAEGGGAAAGSGGMLSSLGAGGGGTFGGELFQLGGSAGAGGGGFGGAEMLSSLGGSGGSFGGDLFQLGGGAEGSIGSGGMNSLLSNLGLGGNSGSMAGQSAFQLPSSAYTPEYLNSLAQYQGVDAGDPGLFSRLTGNTEQGLYRQEGLAKQASGQTVSDLLKKQAQQKALSQLGQSGSKMQQQNDAQQAEQNRMAQQQAMMRRGQAVDTTTALLSLLQDREQQSKQPRISLI